MSFEREGHQLFTNVVSEDSLELLRIEVDRITSAEGAACVRNLMSKSKLVTSLATSYAFRNLLPQNYVAVRSILFDKNPQENWPVAWHQDLSIAVKHEVKVEGYGPWSNKRGVVHVQPPSEVLQSIRTLRLHLDETPEENGALLVLPKSHQYGRLEHSAVEQLDRSNAVVCGCSAGDVLMMSPLILHSSKRSVEPARRRVIHIEYAAKGVLDTSLEWAES